MHRKNITPKASARRPKPQPLSYAQISQLAGWIAENLAEDTETAALLMVLLHEISCFTAEHGDLVIDLLSAAFFAWTCEVTEAEERYVAARRAAFISQLEGKGV